MRAQHLGQPGAALEQGDVGASAGEGPVQIGVALEGRPLVEQDPDGLLGGEVWVARPRPQARDDEAAVQVRRAVFAIGGHFGRLLIFLLRPLERPLLIVRDEFDEDED